MFYTYYVKAEGKYYFGSRTRRIMLKRAAKDDFMIHYFTSTSDERLREIIRKGEYEKAEIIKEYTDRQECLKDEGSLIRLFWTFYGVQNTWNIQYRDCNGNAVFSFAGRNHSEESIKKHKQTLANKTQNEKQEILNKRQQTLANKTQEQKEIEHKNRSEAAKIFMANRDIVEKTIMYNKHSQLMTGEGNPMYGKRRDNISQLMTGEGNPMYGKTGEKNPAFGRKWMNNGIEQIYPKSEEQEHYLSLGYIYGKLEKSPEEKAIIYKNMSEAQKGKLKPKYKWQTPSGEIIIMAKVPVIRFHPDWVFIGPVES